jgi:heptosyltransferase-2
MTAGPPIPRDVQRLFIHLPSWVGDVVMATPVLRAARASCPAARITGLMRRGIEALLAGCADLDEMLPVDAPGLRGALASARAVRRIAPDAALLLPNSFRSAVVFRLAGAPVRAGYARDGRSWLLTHAIPRGTVNHPVPAVDYYADLAQAVFGHAIADRTPRLTVTDSEREEADRLLAGARAPIILVNPGANRHDKRWPAERFADLARRLAGETGGAVAVTGSPDERSLTAEIAERAGECAIDLAARGVSLGGLKGVLTRCALLVTNDTGPRHVAAALGTPAVVLFGPTDHRWTTLPHARERLLLAEPFLPSELLADKHARLCTIDRIPVADAFAAACGLLAHRESIHGAHSR